MNRLVEGETRQRGLGDITEYQDGHLLAPDDRRGYAGLVLGAGGTLRTFGWGGTTPRERIQHFTSAWFRQGGRFVFSATKQQTYLTNVQRGERAEDVMVARVLCGSDSPESRRIVCLPTMVSVPFERDPSTTTSCSGIMVGRAI
jgi:hypothetical protein